MADGLRPDPLGELECSPKPTSRNWGCLLLRGEEKEGKKGSKGMERGKGVRDGEGREGRRRTTCIPHYF